MKTGRTLCLIAALLSSSIASAATLVWTGAGGDGLWSNGVNWDGGTAPADGDDLVFGAQSSTNDLSGLSLTSVTMTAGSPVISGNAVTVGTLHMADGAFLLNGTPFNVIANTSITGGNLKLQAASIGKVAVTGGTLETTTQNGTSHCDSLTLGPGASLAADLYETFWGTSANYLAVSGDIDLTGSSLVVKTGTSSLGQTHTILRNDGPHPVHGTFQGLPEGATFVQNSFVYQITYHAGVSGRDVAVLIPRQTSTLLISSKESTAYGEPVTFTAHIIAWGAAPTGSIEFFDGSTSLGSAPISEWQEAKITTSTLAPGAHVLTAVYPGMLFFTPGTSNTLTQNVAGIPTVPPAPTTTTLTRTPTVPARGDHPTFTAQVRAGNAPASGSVTFYDGETPLGDVTLDAAGNASTQPALGIGTHQIHATFTGSSLFQVSTSNTVTEVVDPIPLLTSMLLISSKDTTVAGEPVTLTAHIIAWGSAPTGSIEFFDGPITLGSAEISVWQEAKITTSSLSTGAHLLTAVYGGTPFFAPTTSNVLTQLVTAAPGPIPAPAPTPATTTTTLTRTPSVATPGDHASFTALVQAEGIIPSGTVSFYDGETSLGEAVLDTSGKATIQPSLTDGTHAIHATFHGSAAFAASTSNTLTEAIVPAVPTTTALSVGGGSAVMAGQPLLLRATVHASSGAPRGTVNFTDGPTSIGGASLDGDQTAALTVTLTPGVHHLSATYLGLDHYSVSTSAPVEQRVQAPAPDCSAPVIVVPPLDAIASASGSVTLSVVTDKKEAESFTWYSGTYPDTSNPIGWGATLILDDIRTPGEVWVLVMNRCGLAYASAHVTVPETLRRRAIGH